VAEPEGRFQLGGPGGRDVVDRDVDGQARGSR
jgi:hypothetical protein